MYIYMYLHIIYIYLYIYIHRDVYRLCPHTYTHASSPHEVREVLGAAQCSLIRINSETPAPGAPPPQDMWTEHRPHAAKMAAGAGEHARVRGALLSRDDVEGVRLECREKTPRVR